jgi:hypothetical protein
MRLFSVVAFVTSVISVGSAHAEGGGSHGHPMGNGGVCGTEASPHPLPPEGALPHHAVAKVLYLNRCSGSCNITAADQQNAPMNITAVQGIPRGAAYTIPEFKNFAGAVGAAADAEWAQIVACVAETYSYFDIQVTDQRPASGNFHMAIVAGNQQHIGLSTDGLLGISQLSCGGPLDNVISFTLAEAHFAGSAATRVRDLCTTVTHEVGHAYGLQHQFRFIVDNSSACSDPMSYDTGTCNPDQRYFRNKIAACGRFEEEPCNCPNNPPNSHQLLNQIFGAGTPTVPPPSVTFTTPAAGGGSISNLVAVTAGSKRGVERVELYLNNWKWLEVQGARFAQGGGQPNPSPYAFQLPANVPNGLYDIEVRAYDDVGAMTSVTTQAVKGAPCASADTCANGQKCEGGKCFWDPPSGAIGDDCTFNEFCTSGVCAGTAEQTICTQNCIPGVGDSCPEGSGLTCVGQGASGVCFFPGDEGGCCSVGEESSTPIAPIALGVGLFGFIVIRRRRN